MIISLVPSIITKNYQPQWRITLTLGLLLPSMALRSKRTISNYHVLHLSFIVFGIFTVSSLEQFLASIPLTSSHTLSHPLLQHQSPHPIPPLTTPQETNLISIFSSALHLHPQPLLLLIQPPPPPSSQPQPHWPTVVSSCSQQTNPSPSFLPLVYTTTIPMQRILEPKQQSLALLHLTQLSVVAATTMSTTMATIKR